MYVEKGVKKLAPIVEMKGIYKEFPNVVALNHVDFSLEKGEIHALIGENGAGKSTLMKILYGIYDQDEGTVKINGEEKNISDAREAMRLGIGMVHQEFMLAETMTVLENIILGFEPNKHKLLDYDKAYSEVMDYSEKYGFEIRPNSKVINISVGEAQRVEILKALYRGAEVLILDEPTAVLTPQETEELFKIIRSLKENGKTIIFISHKLDEVLEIADRITVMRKGNKVETLSQNDATKEKLAYLMVGREVFLDFEIEENEPGDRILEVKNLNVFGRRKLSNLKDVSFEIKEGEILGVAGIDGNGQTELVEALTGLRKVESGEIKIRGEEITNKSPLEIRHHGVSHIPEDRNKTGLCKELTIQENLIANKLPDDPYSSKIGIINFKRVKNFAEELIDKFDIRPPKTDVKMQNLSGGNAQKVIVAREVAEDAGLIIASQPTRGIDIGSIEFIRSVLLDERKAGKAVLLVSADLEEILSLSDRIIVMYEGEIQGTLDIEEANENNLGLMMTGGNPDFKGGVTA
ncbi:nucleoside ABC transporter ATP-binding protein [Halanaerobium sp. MA284_MarDTE_T2]|nr:nucleoside ABC transporter ATP-binding protein [Halanaerobium sp. MA284_MarDTE_T2]RCW89172.1 nucleoside ABC transporter ATP-binding protein [Halanaerobium sp. DL-01]